MRIYTERKGRSRGAASHSLAGLVLLAAFSVAGCACFTDEPGESATVQTGQPVLSVASYDCGERGTLTVRWTPDMAEVTAQGGSWLLPRAQAGSGARYADSRREVWEHQGALRWTNAGAEPVTCRKWPVRSAVRWAGAK